MRTGRRSTRDFDALARSTARAAAARFGADRRRSPAGPAALADRRKALEAELDRIEAELARYAEAIGAGEPLPSILEAMRPRERRRQELHAQLTGLGAHERRPSVARADVYRTLSRRLTD